MSACRCGDHTYRLHEAAFPADLGLIWSENSPETEGPCPEDQTRRMRYSGRRQRRHSRQHSIRREDSSSLYCRRCACRQWAKRKDRCWSWELWTTDGASDLSDVSRSSFRATHRVGLRVNGLISSFSYDEAVPLFPRNARSRPDERIDSQTMRRAHAMQEQKVQ